MLRNEASYSPGPNQEAILHALIMGRGKMSREGLDMVLPRKPGGRRSERGATRNALTALRKPERLGLDIDEDRDPVVLRSQANVWIDLWEFFDLYESGRYAEAEELIAGGFTPEPLIADAEHNQLWSKTIIAFEEASKVVRRRGAASSSRKRGMREVRERLLERSLIPGVGREVPIGAVRNKVEAIGFPWKEVRPAGDDRRDPLPAYLAALLGENEGHAPERIVVTGPHGGGKTLAAISTYLLLTDNLDESAASGRLVLFIDGFGTHSGEAKPAVGSDSWFTDRLREANGSQGGGRPTLIVAHGDSFFEKAAKTQKMLGRRAFQECNVLICCGEGFYEENLRYEDYPGRVLRLGAWTDADQRAFSTAVFGSKAWRAFERWRDEDQSEIRKRLCRVPLHLSYALPIIEEGGQALESISPRSHLFAQLTSARLESSRLGTNTRKVRAELAAVAYRFHSSASKEDTSVTFTWEELEGFLRGRGERKLKSRLHQLLHKTLIEPAPQHGANQFRFEEPAWSFYFLASYLVEVLIGRVAVDDRAACFAKELPELAIELCEEMLRESASHHAEEIESALRDQPSGRARLGRNQKATAKRQMSRLSASI